MTQAKDTPPVSTRPEPQPSGSAAGPAPRGTTDLVAEDPPHTRAVSRAIRRTRRAMVAERRVPLRLFVERLLGTAG